MQSEIEQDVNTVSLVTECFNTPFMDKGVPNALADPGGVGSRGSGPPSKKEKEEMRKEEKERGKTTSPY